ncbi:potassium channel AKT1-like protein [Tanacetum coccineum]
MQKMIESNAPFARKFHRDDLVLDKIDSKLLFWGPERIVPGGWCIGSHENGSDPKNDMISLLLHDADADFYFPTLQDQMVVAAYHLVAGHFQQHDLNSMRNDQSGRYPTPARHISIIPTASIGTVIGDRQQQFYNYHTDQHQTVCMMLGLLSLNIWAHRVMGGISNHFGPVHYIAWVSPFEFGFLKKPRQPLSIIDNVVNGFFGIAIVLTFFLAYLDRNWRKIGTLTTFRFDAPSLLLVGCFYYYLAAHYPNPCKTWTGASSAKKPFGQAYLNFLFYSLLDKAYLFHGVSNDLLFQLNEAPTDFSVLVTGAVDLVTIGEAKTGELCGEIGANVGDGTVIMNSLLQDINDPLMKGVLMEIENMLARGRLDLPLSLCFATLRGDDLLLQKLLKRCLDANRSDNNGRTALHIAHQKETLTVYS